MGDSARSLAFILGTGLDELAKGGEELHIETEFGDHSAALYRTEIAGRPVHVLLRHGKRHRIPPHKINYRANIKALHNCGVTDIIAFGAAGTLDLWRLRVGCFAVPKDFIDRTKEVCTFFDDRVVHTAMNKPFDVELNKLIVKLGRRRGLKMRPNCVYVGSSGPRYMTFYEMVPHVKWLPFFKYSALVGMTVVHEVILAKEIGIRYANCSMITDGNIPDHQEIERRAAQRAIDVKGLIEELCRAI